MPSFLSRLLGSSMCENCGQQPKFDGYDYCGKSCSAEAEKKKRSAAGLGCGSGRGKPAAPGPPKMCKNCNAKLAFSSYSYCGKRCAAAAKGKKRTQAAQPGPNGLCAYCKVRPAYGSYRHCGKACASMAARQMQSHNAPVIGYSAGYQVPLSASDNGPYGSPSGYATAGPPYSYSPGSSMYSSPRGYEDSQRGGSRSSPTQRTPNRAPPRGSSITAPDFGSEDEYPSESSDDDRRRPVRQPIPRRDEGDSPSESDSGYPTSEEEEERGDRRRGDDRQSSSAQPETQSSQPNAAAPSMIDTLCIVCRRFPKYSGHPFCSRQCRDSLILSQAQGIAPYPVASGVGQAQFPGASMPPPVSDAPPPAYSDIEDR